MKAEKIEYITQNFNTQENIIGYAGQLHDEWRATRQETKGEAVDGQPMREPRLKLSDPNNPNSEQVDIANLPFYSLPPAWQEENLRAAENAMNDIQNITDNGHDEVVDLEEVAARIHQGWKKRNKWADGEQAGPYSDLSSQEKDKDRKILIGAIQYLADKGYEIRAVNKGWMWEDARVQEIAKLEQQLKDLGDKSEKDPTQADGSADEIRMIEMKLNETKHELEQYRFIRATDRHERDRYDPAKQETGTEGALLSPPIFGAIPDSEEKYGFKDGETRERKQERRKIELLIELGRDEPRCFAEAYRIAQGELEKLYKEYEFLVSKPLKKGDLRPIDVCKNRIQNLLNQITPNFKDVKVINIEPMTDEEIAKIESRWKINNLKKGITTCTNRIDEINNLLADTSINDKEKAELEREVKIQEWNIGICKKSLEERGIELDEK